MSTFSNGYITRTDLAQAFRKAKADTSSEKSLNTAIAFAAFEDALYANLEILYKKLTKKVPVWPATPDFIGGFVFIPKKLTFDAPGSDPTTHFISSDPTVAWEVALRTGTPKAEFRPIADFTVEMHVVSSLWVNKVGHKFDASLDDSSYGARVRRYRAEPNSGTHGAFQIDAVGTFKPYFSAYRSWRQDGMTAARKALQNGDSVVVVTMDLQSYYHSIDPNFILNHTFHRKAGVHSGRNKLTADDIAFTQQIVTAMETWARQIPGIASDGPVGLPVGPAAARVMANCLLCDFDRQMQTKLSPIHYGRYIDDVLLVLRATKRLTSPNRIITHLIDRVPLLLKADEGMKMEPGYAALSQLRFNTSKLHTFHLTPVAGEDLLDTIQRRIQDVSSEWRLLPDPDELDSSPAAKVLAASRDPGDEADSFARADHLSIRRLGLSIMLRNCDALARDLPPDEWKKSRYRFYAFSEAYVLSPLRLFEQHPYFAKLIGLAIACGDFGHAQSFVRAIVRSLRQLEAKTEAMDGGWPGIRRHLSRALYEGVVKAVSDDARSMDGVAAVLKAIDRISPTGWEDIDVARLSTQLRQYDLARKPLKDYLFDKTIGVPVGQPIDAAYHESEEWRTDGVGEFLNHAQYDNAHLRPMMFPTRPHTPSEIAELVVEATLDIGLWRRLTRAVRGVWVSEVEPSLQAIEPLVDVPARTQRTKLRIAVPSYKTELESWSHAANGGADLSRLRYRRLVQLVNAIVTCEDRPRYAVFPELSIPRKWIRPVANTLLKEGISLIAGVEYERSGTYVRNEAHLFLRNNALGYPSFFRLIQQKHIPAHDERDHLRSMFGVTFPPLPPAGLGKAIYDHGGFRFGVLICSELSNAEHRVVFRGNVDAVFVLCWNQDLESFEAMLDAAALDIHSYQVLVNNRLYGDSRVRSPFKERWRRDVVRIKGGIEDYVVVAELDVEELRHFQSHAEPPKDGMFKPTPEGFVLNPARKVVPIAKP
jgi:predicted amidohydrolase